MAGISDAALGKLNSQNKFNGGSELEEDYGVNLYSTFYRRYDPQIGRFSGVDCQSEASAGMSVYQFGGNNPVSMNDPLGNRQTAGLYGGTNSYYNFNPGYNSHDKSGYWHYDNPNEGSSWMDSGDNGGGGNGGGSYGAPDYSAFWNPVLYKVSNGEELTEFNKVEGKKYYNYSNVSGSGMFETPNNEGLITNAVGEKYYFYGTTTRTNYEGSANYSEKGTHGWETISTVSETFDRSMVATGDVIFSSLALSSSLTKETFNIISDVPVLKQLGYVTTAVSIYNHASKFYKDPNWKDGLELAGNVAILAAKVLFPEATVAINAAEFIYNNITTVVDLFDSE